MGKRASLLLLFLLALPLSWAQDNTAREYFQQGEQRFISGDYFGAIQAYREALEENPHYLEALIQLSRSYFMIEEYQEAQNFIKQAEVYGRNNLELLNMEARILVGRNDLEQARNRFQAVLEREPNNLEANLGLAEVLLLMGNHQEGAVAYRRSLILAPESKRALLSMMLLFDSRGDYEMGQIYLDLALKYHSRDGQVFLQAARHYLAAGDLEKAIYYGENAIQMNPDMEGPDFLLGAIYYRQGGFEQARELLQREVSRNPEEMRPLFLLARILEELGEYSQALVLYQRILHQEPLDEITRLLYEALIRRIGPDGQSLVNQAADFHFQEGQRWEEEFDFPRAQREYRRARWLQPYHYDSWLASARLWERQGYPEKSLYTLRVIEETGYDDQAFLDDLRMKEHSRVESLADQYEINQFTQGAQPYRLSLFFRQSSSLFHYSAQQPLTEYLSYYLMGFDSIDLPMSPMEVQSYSQAFQAARQQGSEYFLLLDVHEEERSILLSATLYLSRTGMEIESYNLLRMGKYRVQDSFQELAVRIERRLLPRGMLLELEDGQALINLGRLQGAESGQQYRVFRQDSVNLLSQEPWLEFNPSDYLGWIDIIQSDEAVALGTWNNRGPFVLAAQEDEIYLYPQSSQDIQETQTPYDQAIMDQELKRQLLMLQ